MVTPMADRMQPSASIRWPLRLQDAHGWLREGKLSSTGLGYS